MAKHDLDPNYLDPNYEPVVNHTGNSPFHEVLAARMQRRSVMKGTVGAALASIMGVGLAACGSDSDSNAEKTMKRVYAEEQSYTFVLGLEEQNRVIRIVFLFVNQYLYQKKKSLIF